MPPSVFRREDEVPTGLGASDQGTPRGFVIEPSGPSLMPPRIVRPSAPSRPRRLLPIHPRSGVAPVSNRWMIGSVRRDVGGQTRQSLRVVALSSNLPVGINSPARGDRSIRNRDFSIRVGNGHSVFQRCCGVDFDETSPSKKLAGHSADARVDSPALQGTPIPRMIAEKGRRQAMQRHGIKKFFWSLETLVETYTSQSLTSIALCSSKGAFSHASEEDAHDVPCFPVFSLALRVSCIGPKAHFVAEKCKVPYSVSPRVPRMMRPRRVAFVRSGCRFSLTGFLDGVGF